jgi:hypothetical protein
MELRASAGRMTRGFVRTKASATVPISQESLPPTGEIIRQRSDLQDSCLTRYDIL